MLLQNLVDDNKVISIVDYDSKGNELAKTFKVDEFNDQEMELVGVEDESGKHELTAIPQFDDYKADLKRGKIYSLVSERFLSKGKPNLYGYCYSTLRNNDGKATPTSLHAVMMSAALGKTPQEWRQDGLEIDHRNGIKHDNRIVNLRLVTRKEQYTDEVRERMSRNATAPLTREQVQTIRYIAEVVKVKSGSVGSELIHVLANQYGKGYETIRQAILGVTHSSVELTDEMKSEIRRIQLKEVLEQLDLAG